MEQIIANVKGIMQRVQKNLECSICLEVLAEPYSTQCNHQFCRECINELLSRKNRKSGASCPLCKSKLSKRGLTQNKNLVRVVGAVRKVLQAINEDAKISGKASPIIEASQKENKHDLREETPSQILDRGTLSDKNEIEIATSSLMKSEEIVKENDNKGNTRRSRKLYWAEMKNIGQNVTANNDLLQTLESSKLGRKTRKSSRNGRMSSRQDKEVLSLDQNLTMHSRIRHDRNTTFSKGTTTSSSLQSDTTGFQITESSAVEANHEIYRNERMQKDPSMIDIPNGVTTSQKSIVAETPLIPIHTELHEDISSEIMSRVDSETRPIAKKMSPFAETPLIPIRTKLTEDMSCEATSHLDSGARPATKKISPFAENAFVKAVIEPRSPNVFDFVEDDNSDLCERVKRRSKRVNPDTLNLVRNKTKDKKITAKGDRVIMDTLDVELDSKSKKRKGRIAISKKTEQDLDSKPGVKRVRFRTKSLLEGAWNTNRDGSQVIESGHTDSCVEASEAGDHMECQALAKTDEAGVKNIDDNAGGFEDDAENSTRDVAENLETPIAGSPVISLENHKSNEPASEATNREEMCSPSKEKLTAVNHEFGYKGSSESDVVPPSVPSPDTSLVSVIDPMECYLYGEEVPNKEVVTLVKGNPEIQGFLKRSINEQRGRRIDKIIQKLQLAKPNGFLRVVNVKNACNSAVETAESEKMGRESRGENQIGKEAVVEQLLDLEVTNQNVDNEKLSVHLFSELIASESCQEANIDSEEKTHRSSIDKEELRTDSCSDGIATKQADKGTIFTESEGNCKITNTGERETVIKTLNEKRSSQQITVTTAKGVELAQCMTESSADKLGTGTDRTSNKFAPKTRTFAEPVSNSQSTCENIDFGTIVKDDTPQSGENDLFSHETFFTENCATRKSIKNKLECKKGSEMTEQSVIGSMQEENAYSTQEDLTHGSVSILHRQSQIEFANDEGKEMVSNLNPFAEDLSAKPLKRNSVAQTNVSSDMVAKAVSGVSKACQTEHDPTTDANLTLLQANGHQTRAVDVHSLSTSSNCQLCIGCQRHMHDTPTEIFELVKTNIRQSVEQHRSSKLITTLKEGRYSLKFSASGLIAGPPELASLDKSSARLKEDDAIGISISRLSFVPVWPEPRLDDELEVDVKDEPETHRITRSGPKRIGKNTVDNTQCLHTSKKTDIDNTSGRSVAEEFDGLCVEDTTQEPCLRRSRRLKNASQPDCSIKAKPEESEGDVEIYGNFDNEEMETNVIGDLVSQEACDNPGSQGESEKKATEGDNLTTTKEGAKFEADSAKSRDVFPPTPPSPVKTSPVNRYFVTKTSKVASPNKDEMGIQAGLDNQLSMEGAKVCGRSGDLEELEGNNSIKGELKDSILSDGSQKSNRDLLLGNEINKQADNSLHARSKELLVDVSLNSQRSSKECSIRINLKRKAKMILKDDLSGQNLVKKVKVENSENINDDNKSNGSSQDSEAQKQNSQICSGVVMDSFGDISSQILRGSGKNRETDHGNSRILKVRREPEDETTAEPEINRSFTTAELQLTEKSFQITERKYDVINDSQTMILLDTPEPESGTSEKGKSKTDQNMLDEVFKMNIATYKKEEMGLQENKIDFFQEGKCDPQTEIEQERENIASEAIPFDAEDVKDDNEKLNKSDGRAGNLVSEVEPDLFDSSGQSLVKLADTSVNFQDEGTIFKEDQPVNEVDEPVEAEEEATCHAGDTTVLYGEEQQMHSEMVVNELLENGGGGFSFAEKTEANNSSRCYADDTTILYPEQEQKEHVESEMNELPGNGRDKCASVEKMDIQNSPQSKMYATFIFDDERDLFGSYDDEDQREKEAASGACGESNPEDFFTPPEEANSKNATPSLKDKSKSDFKNLVKEVTKAQDTSSQESVENDDDDLCVKPCVDAHTGKESKRSYFSNMDVDSTANEIRLRQNKEKVDERDGCSPPSPTPPPRVKRKRSSPPEIQATLKELKKVLYMDDIPQNTPLHDKAKHLKLSNQKAFAKPPVVIINEVAGKKEDSNHSYKTVVVKDHLKDQGTPEAAKRNQCREHRSDFLKTNVANENVKREIIKTPIIKTEKRGLMERRTINTPERTPENASKSEKRMILPKIIIPSRLSRKEMSYCKYLAEKMGSKFSTSYIPGTTHLVMSTDESLAIDRSYYTYKYLMALITGSWIVSLKWVLGCFQAGRPIPENSFEVKGDPSSNQELVPRSARISRQKKEPPLFEGLALTLIGNFKTSQMTKDQLVEMLTIGGAKVLHELPDIIPPKNFLLIADQEALDARLQSQFLEASIQPVNYEWITESIINYKVKDPMDFLFRLET